MRPRSVSRFLASIICTLSLLVAAGSAQAVDTVQLKADAITIFTESSQFMNELSHLYHEGICTSGGRPNVNGE